ncbi:MAG: cysteine desulfuration protein SufE [Bradymonadia bacterium]|jgi:cysteine desulfuration protein SufE
MTEPTQTPTERAAEITERLAKKTDWQGRYREIIALGRELAPLDDEHRTDKNKVKGCQSQVWLHPSLEGGTVRYAGDSDATIVKGLVAIVLHVYSGSTPEQILATPPTFIDDIGLSQNLSQTRSNGLSAMIKQVHMYAAVFRAMAAAQR